VFHEYFITIEYLIHRYFRRMGQLYLGELIKRKLEEVKMKNIHILIPTYSILMVTYIGLVLFLSNVCANDDMQAVMKMNAMDKVENLMLKPSSNLPAATFDSKKTKQLVDKLLLAHGMKSPWQKGKTLSYTHSLYIMNFPEPLNPWWISHEQYQYTTKRGYHYYPMEDALLVFKKGQTFYQKWSLPNPPGMMPFFNFNIAMLPWLPKEHGAVVSYTGERKLPNQEVSYPTIKLQFIAGATHTPDNYLRLYIEESSGLLKGVEYNSTYAPMLDAMGVAGDQFGPGFHIYTSYKKVADRLFPERYETYFSNKLAGVHAISNISIDKPFDEVIAHRPGNLNKVTAHPTLRMNVDRGTE